MFLLTKKPESQMPEYQKPESKTCPRARIGTIWDTIPISVLNYRRVARIETVSKFDALKVRAGFDFEKRNRNLLAPSSTSSEFEGASLLNFLKKFD